MQATIPFRGYRLRPLVDMLNDNISRDDKEAVLLAIWTLRRADRLDREEQDRNCAGVAP